MYKYIGFRHHIYKFGSHYYVICSYYYYYYSEEYIEDMLLQI